MKKFLKLNLIMLLLFILTLNPVNNTVYTHTGSSCKKGSEYLGWVVHCNSHPGHLGQAVTTYSYASDLTTAYKNYAKNGALRWNSSGLVKMTYSSTSNNVIFQYNDSNSSVVAKVKSTTFNGHKRSWSMHFNHYDMKNRTVSKNNGIAAHEFGHVIGLVDLYDSGINKNKLMYGRVSGTATYPYPTDLEGVREAIK